MKRGGGFGTEIDCINNCKTIENAKPIAYGNCLKGCNRAFNQDNIQSYDVKINNTEGDSYMANYPDADKYQ